MKHRAELFAVMDSQAEDAAAMMTIAEAERKMREQDVPFARVNRLAELPEDEQIRHNEMFRELDHPVAGPLRDARPAPRFLKTPAAPGGPAPTVGQHTREVLEQIGLSDKIDHYYEQGIVC
jgi:crotonobetainyl-CoA:carnitine CoA-transferase CaiB-like acyl-CoA transferase